MPATLDRSKHVRIWWEEFRILNLWDKAMNPGGTWKPTYTHNNLPPEHPNGWDCRTLKGNKEAQVYVGGMERLGVPSPYRIDGGQLVITADRTPAELKPKVWGFPYVSGMISTEKVFSFQYGYYEMRAKLPAGKGLWPAFWLLPITKGPKGEVRWPPEIDVLEALCHKPRSHFCSVHSAKGSSTTEAVHADLTSKFNTFGLLWTKDELVWYQNDQEVRRIKNPGIHEAMYMVIDLAVGGKGSWPGEPDASTKFPAEMRVDWVRVWMVKP